MTMDILSPEWDKFYLEKTREECLQDFNLLDKLIDEVEKKVVGERETIRCILLASFGTFVENAQKTSFNLLVNDESGAGKDWVVSKALELLPKEWWVKRTRISERVMSYWHNPKFEPDWTWDGKIFYNEDISESVLNSDVFKVMASTGSDATLLIKQTPVDIKIRGKPVLMVTTATATPSLENVRRFMIVNLDTTIDQTKAIMQRQAQWAKEGKDMEFLPYYTEALKAIKPKKVKIPYADMLPNFFPTNIFIRTHFSRFLDYVKASAVLHQFQREWDEEGYIIAAQQDYVNARLCFLKFTTNPQMLPLTKDQKKILEIFEEKMKKGWYDMEDVEGYVTFMSDRWLRIQLNYLANLGFLSKESQKTEDSKKKVIFYSLNDSYNFNIPLYEQLNEMNEKNDMHEQNNLNDISMQISMTNVNANDSEGYKDTTNNVDRDKPEDNLKGGD